MPKICSFDVLTKAQWRHHHLLRHPSLVVVSAPPNPFSRSRGTVLDARAYMLRLSKDRERSARWQRVAQLLLAKADVGTVTRQLELALLYDGKLDVRAMA